MSQLKRIAKVLGIAWGLLHISCVVKALKEVKQIKKDKHLFDVAFQGKKATVKSGTFPSQKIRVCFGGLDLDLSEADFEPGTVLEIDAFYGGVQLRLPRDLTVNIESHSFLGGVACERPQVGNAELFIVCHNMFGGVDVK